MLQKAVRGESTASSRSGVAHQYPGGWRIPEVLLAWIFFIFFFLSPRGALPLWSLNREFFCLRMLSLFLFTKKLQDPFLFGHFLYSGFGSKGRYRLEMDAWGATAIALGWLGSEFLTLGSLFFVTEVQAGATERERRLMVCVSAGRRKRGSRWLERSRERREVSQTHPGAVRGGRRALGTGAVTNPRQ